MDWTNVNFQMFTRKESRTRKMVWFVVLFDLLSPDANYISFFFVMAV